MPQPLRACSHAFTQGHTTLSLVQGKSTGAPYTYHLPPTFASYQLGIHSLMFLWQIVGVIWSTEDQYTSRTRELVIYVIDNKTVMQMPTLLTAVIRAFFFVQILCHVPENTFLPVTVCLANPVISITNMNRSMKNTSEMQSHSLKPPLSHSIHQSVCESIYYQGTCNFQVNTQFSKVVEN